MQRVYSNRIIRWAVGLLPSNFCNKARLAKNLVKQATQMVLLVIVNCYKNQTFIGKQL